LKVFAAKARAATRKFAMAQSDHWMEVRNEAIAFCFENQMAAVLFAGHCTP
jgi:hypothetical protein